MNKCFHAIVGTTLLASSVLLAQEPPARQPGTQPAPTTQDRTRTDATNESDRILATWLLVDNENEIAFSRIAVTRAQSQEVKDFAQKMITDHGQIVQKLQPFAGGTSKPLGQAGIDPNRPRDTTNPTNPNRSGTDPNRSTTDPNRSGTDPNRSTTDPSNPGDVQPRDASGVRAMGNLDHERLARDLGRKCLESGTKMLNEKSGAEFDKCFMGMQLAAHVRAVDTIEVFRNYASASLRPTLDEGLKTVQMHLQHAKDLVKRTEVASADAPRK